MHTCLEIHITSVSRVRLYAHLSNRDCWCHVSNSAELIFHELPLLVDFLMHAWGFSRSVPCQWCVKRRSSWGPQVFFVDEEYTFFLESHDLLWCILRVFRVPQFYRILKLSDAWRFSLMKTFCFRWNFTRQQRTCFLFIIQTRVGIMCVCVSV